MPQGLFKYDPEKQEFSKSEVGARPWAFEESRLAALDELAAHRPFGEPSVAPADPNGRRRRRRRRRDESDDELVDRSRTWQRLMWVLAITMLLIWMFLITIQSIRSTSGSTLPVLKFDRGADAPLIR